MGGWVGGICQAVGGGGVGGGYMLVGGGYILLRILGTICQADESSLGGTALFRWSTLYTMS